MGASDNENLNIEALETTEHTEATQAHHSEQKIEYTHWFAAKLKENKKLRAHHYDAILAFFKGRKLSESEHSHKFETALKEFGF